MELVPRRKRQLTQSLPKEFTRDEFVAPEVVRWHCNGLTISGLLYRPPRKRGLLPAILYVHEGYADPKRLAITGASYGGYLTMTALTRHSQVFAVGSAIVPFFNWFTEYENERADLVLG